MSKFKTALAFSKNLLTTGALFQTSEKVEHAITSKITDKPNQIVVEFGMGHGNITKEILNKLHPSSQLFSFEINKEFCDLVAEQIKDERLTILNEGAEDIIKLHEKPINSIVSSIPFTIFPKEKTDLILQNSYDCLENEGFFSQIQYSRVLKKKFESAFDVVILDQVSKLPPEFIFHCRKI